MYSFSGGEIAKTAVWCPLTCRNGHLQEVSPKGGSTVIKVISCETKEIVL